MLHPPPAKENVDEDTHPAEHKNQAVTAREKVGLSNVLYPQIALNLESKCENVASLQRQGLRAASKEARKLPDIRQALNPTVVLEHARPPDGAADGVRLGGSGHAAGGLVNL